MNADFVTGILDGQATSLSGFSVEEPLVFMRFDGSSREFKPDPTKGFFEFDLAYSVPRHTDRGTALHAAVVARSFESLLFQQINMEHRVGAYHPGKQISDAMFGTVVDVSYPSDGARFDFIDRGDNVPHIKGVATFSKLAAGMRSFLGAQATGRRPRSVSMEVNYKFDESGFLLPHRNGKAGKKFAESTPHDLGEAGFDYIPWGAAPEELRGTFSRQKMMITGTFDDVRPLLLMGGVEGDVHFSGVGVVRAPAEKSAGIGMVAASSPFAPVTHPFQSLAAAFQTVRRLK